MKARVVTPASWPRLSCEVFELGTDNLAWLLRHWEEYQPNDSEVRRFRENAIWAIKEKIPGSDPQAPLFANLRPVGYFSLAQTVLVVRQDAVCVEGYILSFDGGMAMVRPFNPFFCDPFPIAAASADIMTTAEAAYLLTHPDFLKIWLAISAAPIA